MLMVGILQTVYNEVTQYKVMYSFGYIKIKELFYTSIITQD